MRLHWVIVVEDQVAVGPFDSKAEARSFFEANKDVLPPRGAVMLLALIPPPLVSGS